MSSSVYQIDLATSSNQWSDDEWGEWDKMLSHEPSAYLHSKTIRAALDVEARNLQAVRWLDSSGEIVGIAQVEDTHAMSVSQGKFLKADKPFFKLAQTYLYRGDGVFQFDVRVLGTVLASGAHAYRFSEVMSEKEKFKAIHQALDLPRVDGSKAPKTRMVKDHYSDKPYTEKLAGKSKWHCKWIDLEFDPVMEVDLDPSWSSFDEYSSALRKKSRTKIRRIFRGSEELVLKDLSLGEIEENLDQLHSLYKQVYDRAGFTLGSLLKEDLVSLKKHWGDDFLVIAYFLEEDLVGFQCGIKTENTTEAFFVGFTQEENKMHFMYQRMLLEFIKQGIDKGASKVAMGRTALDIKSSLGACPKRMMCHMRISNPIIHLLARGVALTSSPKIPALKRAWDDDRVSIFAAGKS